MTLWWLEPGWKDAVCRCGVNIWKSGGDPDWGECYECKCARHEQEQREPEPPLPRCEICGQHEAVTDIRGTPVCSAECAEKVP